MAHVDANVVQQSFRVRNDDGSETAATWREPVNSDWGQSLDEVFRVRVLIEETAGGNANNYSYVLQYSINGGAWTLVSTSTPVKSTPSAFVANATPTTQQLGAGSFVAGEFDSDSSASNISLASQQTEMEYCLTLDSAQLAFGDTIQLRATNGGTALNGYTNTPTISVAVIGDLAATLADTTATVAGTVTYYGPLAATLGDTELTATAYHSGPEYVEPYYVEPYYTITSSDVQIPTGDIAATLEGVSASIGMTRFPAYWKKISGSTTILAGEVSFYVVLQVDPDNNGGWWFDEVRATVNGGANQLTNGTFNAGTKNGWTLNPEQDGLVVDPGAVYDPPGAYTLQIDADPNVVQQQASDSFAVAEGDTVYVEAWVYFYGGVNSNGKANGRAKNASDEVVRTATITETSPDPDVVTGELAAALEGTTVDINAFHAVVGNLNTTLADTTVAMAGEHTAQIVTGDLAATLEGSSVSASGDHGAVGDVAASLEDSTATGAATHGVAGDIAAQLAGTEAAITVEHLIAGDLVAALESTEVSASAVHGVAGSISASLADTTAALSGEHLIAGDLFVQLESTEATLSGDHGVVGDISASLADTTAAITVEHLISGDLSVQLDSTAADFTGSFGNDVEGDLVAQLSDAVVIATGGHGATGDLSATLDATTAAFTGETYEIISGDLVTTLEGAQATFEGSHGVAGDLSAALEGTQASFDADHLIAGTLTAQLAATTASMEGTAGDAQSGTMHVSLEGTSAASTGDHGVAGTLTTSMGDLTLEIVADHGVKGSSSVSLADATVAMAGSFEDVTVEGDIYIELEGASAALEGEHYAQTTADIAVSLEGAGGQFTGSVGGSGSIAVVLDGATALFTFKPPSLGRPANPGVVRAGSIPGVGDTSRLVGAVDASEVPGVADVSGTPSVTQLP